MIKEIRYKNFKALRDATLPLGRFTLIVGANGTGKTSAIKGFSVLKKPKKFSWNDISSVEADIDSIVSITAVTDFIKIQEAWQFLGYVDKEAEDEFDNIYLPLYDLHIFNFDSDKLAESVSVNPNAELDESGRGLAGVLDQLRDSDPEKFEELNNELKNWFPEFDRILFEVPSQGKKTFLLRTKSGKHKIKAEDLSDGTRLAFAYLTLAYLPNPPKIVAFEEPEKGIHPRLLRNIQEAMYRLAYPENYGEKREPTQVIATTHSPYLLDLYKDHPEEIVISSKDENGVHFERLIDKPHYEEILEDAPLGEVWYSGVLGGVPAQV